MRRVVDHVMLMFASTVLLMAGCSNSPSQDVAEALRSAGVQSDSGVADSGEAGNRAASENNDVPILGADDPNAASERAPEPVEIAEGGDSDDPGSYLAPPADQSASGSPPKGSRSPNEAGGGDETTKESGRGDGDDPSAAIVVAKTVEPQVDAPLDNGREPNAKPVPEAQRVAAASKSVEPGSQEAGRDPNGKPGAESPAAKPAQEQPTTKPAAPSRKTLADLSKEVQELDKDGDGQLGVYEWPREKLAQFKTLDSNEDGFLTPAELFDGQKKAADAEAKKSESKPAEGSPAETREETETPAADDAKKAEPTDAASDDE